MRRLVLALLLLAGCGVQVREASAVQPNPARALHSVDEIPQSVTLYIYQRDHLLSRDYQLRNSASFVVVSRDRLRFHVGIVRREEDDADTVSWDAWLEDAHGHRIARGEREVAHVDRISVGWALYPYRVDDSWCRQTRPCLRRLDPGRVFDVYEGRADYVFTAPDLATSQDDGFTLVLRRGGVEYRYAWLFGGHTEVRHYGRTKVDDDVGTLAIPGPYTVVAGTKYESDRW
ncbi:MAG TPA: hypothetical protein VKE22_12020 [Haliangiales bacterium]|nr:hypothetical protein [Haliangiales bacterium]